MLENLDSKLKEHFKKYYNKKMKKYLKIFFDPFILIYGLFNFLCFQKKIIKVLTILSLLFIALLQVL